jgi:pimeloyl-ACP methyl ester carboxylesterase
VRFAAALGLRPYALYLHDYGSQFGVRLAMETLEPVAALIIQNGDIYEDEFGPKYDWLKDYWANPTPKGRSQMAENESEEQRSRPGLLLGDRREGQPLEPSRLFSTPEPEAAAPVPVRRLRCG